MPTKQSRSAPSCRLEELPLNAITPSPFQPRADRDTPGDLDGLAASIRRGGVLQPILVRPAGSGRKAHELVAGHRRWKAAKRAGQKTILAIVREMSDQEAAEATMAENHHRENLTPLEESRVATNLIQAFNGNLPAAADAMARTPAWVARRANLQQLTERWRTAAQDPASPVSRWSATHLELIALLGPGQQEELFESLAAYAPRSLRDLSQLIDRELKVLGNAPWDLADESLVPEAGACSSCPLRTSAQPDLFSDSDPEIVEQDRCRDAPCWQRKLDAHTERRIDRAKAEGQEVIPLCLYRHGSTGPAGAVMQHEVERTPKSKGGRLCIWVEGPRQGETFYGTLRKDDASSTGSSRSKISREERLERRRLKWMIEHLQALLAPEQGGGPAVPDEQVPALETLAALAAAFGLPRYHGLHYDPRSLPESLESVRREKAFVAGGKHLVVPWVQTHHWIAQQERLRMDLWTLVAGELARHIAYTPRLPADRLREEVHQVLSVLGRDYKDLWAQACREIPIPKSWDKERGEKKLAKAA